MSNQSNLAELYTAFFNRAPDSAGLAYWVKELDSGVISLEQIAKNWVESQPEGQAKYPSGMTTTEFVNAIYGNVLNRASDAEGLAYWQKQLDSGLISRDTFVAAVINGAKSNTTAQGKADAALLANKATVGVAFADKGLNDTSLAAKVLTSVTADSNTLNATLNLIKLVPSTAAGQTTAVLNSLNTALTNVANLIKSAPGELGDLATYLNAVLSGVTSNTNLDTLFASINTKVVAAQTNPSALDDAANQGANDASIATPTAGGGDPGTPPVTTPTFTVTNGSGEHAGTFTVGTQNGEVKITISGTDVTFTPKTGTAVVVKLADITQGLVINGSVKVSAADLTTLTANEHQVTGTGTVSLGSDSLQNLANTVFGLKSHVEAHLAYTLTDGTFTAPEGSPVTVAQGEESLELLQIIVSGATNGASITLNAVFSLQDTVENLTAAINDESAVMHGRPYSVEDTLEHVLAAKADPESPLSLTDYTLTDAKVDLGQASVADVKASKAQAQEVVDGASNVPPIPLEVTYTVKDSIAHLNAELLLLPNSVLAGHSYSVSDTLDNVLSHYDADTIPAGSGSIELTDTIAHLGENLTVAQAVQATAHVQTVVNALIPDNAIQVTADYTLADSVENLVDSPELLTGHSYSVVDTLQNIVAYLASGDDVLTEGFDYTLTSAEVTVDGPSTAAQALALKGQYEALVAGALNSDDFTLKLVASLVDTAANLAKEQYASVVAGQHVEISDAYVSLEQLVAIQTIVGTDDGASVSYSGVAGKIADLLDSHNADLIAEHAVSVTDGLSLDELASLRESAASSVAYTTVSDTVDALTANANAEDVLGKTLHINGNPSFADIALVKAAAGPDGSVSYDIVSDTFAELTDADNAGVVAGHAVEITGTVTLDQIKAVKALEDVGTVSYGTVDLADGTVAPEDAALLEGHALYAAVVSVTLIDNFVALAGAKGFTYGIVTGTYAELTDSANSAAAVGHNLQPEGDVSVAQLRDLQELAGDGQTVSQHLITDTVAHLTDADNATILENHSIKVSDASVTVAQVQALNAIESIDEVIYETLADNAANLILASNEVVAGAVKQVQVSGTASISQLASITGKAPVSLTYTSITDIAENLVANIGGFVKEDVPVTVTGTASLSDLHAIDLKTTGEVSYSSITDTAEHLVADPDHYINSDVAVVVTGAINLSDLTTLAGKADAVEYSSLTGTAAELAADAADQDGAGTFVTNGKAVQVTDAATVEQLALISAAIDGTPDFSEIADTAEALADNTVFVSIAAKVTVTDAASLQQLHDISATLLANEGELAYTAVKDTVEHLTANTDGFVRGAVDVTVTDEATVAAIAAISAATTGKVTAANISDEAGNIVSEEDGVSAYIGADSIVTVTDAVTIAQLKAIAAVNGGEAKLLYTHISDTLENLNADGASAFIKNGITVTVTDDSATVAQLAALDAASNGNLEYIGAINDTAQALADDAALNNGDGKYIAGKTVTVTDAATLLQLANIDDAASELHYTKISDTAEHLVANTGSFVTTGKTVTVIDAASILQLSTIDGYTDVALVYTKVTDSSAALALDTTYVKDGVTVTLTDNGIVAAATLAAIDAKTDVQVDASSVGVVTGNFADVKAAVGASATLKLSGSEVLSVTDTAANLSGKTLDASTSGMDTLHVGLASNITDLTHLTGFEDVTLEGSSRFTNLIKVGGDANEVHALAGSTVSLVGTNQSFWTSADTDIVTMGAGSKFVFAASAAANGTDKISGFTFGAEGNAFDFSSFFGGVATAGSDIVNDTAQFGGGANTVTLVDGNSTVLAAHNTISVADFNSTFLSKVDGKEVIVTFDNTAHAANVYFVNSAGGGAANAVDSAADITLVGTVTYTGSISSAADLNLASHLLAP